MMARTINEIYDSIIAEKEAKANLSTLLPTGFNLDDLLTEISSGSKVANWRLWVYIHAFATWTLENLQDTFKAEVELIKSKAIFGTSLWWVEKMLEFQYGDPIIIKDIDGVSVPAYATIDVSKQIIKASTIVSLGGASTIKVAKEVASELVALDTAEITAVLSYKDSIQPAGVKISVISLNSDLLKLIADVHYSGVLEVATVKTAVETAITDYLKNIEFGGVLNTNKLIDVVQLVDGVEDIEINTVEAKPNAGTYIAVGREYTTSAGYIKVDPANDLDTNLTYIAK